MGPLCRLLCEKLGGFLLTPEVLACVGQSLPGCSHSGAFCPLRAVVSPTGSSLGPSQLSEGLRLPACKGGALLGLCRSLGPSCLGPARAGWWFSFLIFY